MFWNSKTVFFLLMLSFFAQGAIASPDGEFLIHVVTENYPPYQYQKDDGEITGFSVEVVKTLIEKVNQPHDMTLLPWARAYRMALTEANVLIFSIARTPERESLFKWVGVIFSARNCLLALRQRTDIVANSFNDVCQYYIGAVREDTMEQYLNGKGCKVYSNRSHESNFDMLMSKRVDLWAVDELTADYILMQQGYRPNQLVKNVMCLDETSAGGIYLAFSALTDDRLVAKFSNALKEIKEDGIYDKILVKYQGQ